MSGDSPPRQPLHDRLISESNSLTTTSRTPSRTLRLVPSEPPKLLGQRDEIFGRTPLPTHPSHILSPGKGKGRDVSTALHFGFQHSSKTHSPTASTGSSASITRTTPQPAHNVDSATGSPISKPKPVPKKRLQLHKDNKTFSLVSQDQEEEAPQLPLSPTLSTKSSYDTLYSNRSNARVRSNSIISCIQTATSTGSEDPYTPAPASKQTIPADPITSSPWNYQIVGGLRKVPKTPDLKQTTAVTSDSSPPPLPRTSDASTQPSQDLSTKLSFQSYGTSTTTSENTNYKVYNANSPSPSEAGLVPPSSSDSNYQLLGDPSPPVSESSVIYRPHTAISEAISEEYENENYEVHGEPSPTPSYTNLIPARSEYSQESLVVPPLKSRTRRSRENLGYYKQRSRESLRTGSFTSLNSVLTQPEASQGMVGISSSTISQPLPHKQDSTGSWAASLTILPLRSPMDEHPHQWSSQLSTVHSVSDGGTDRNSQSWSDGRVSSGFPSTPSRHSRQMLSISSSMALASEEGDLALERPRAVWASRSPQHLSNSSTPVIEDQDEYGDGITDMQDLTSRLSRTRLSAFYSIGSSENLNERTNTMRSGTSSRTGSMLASTIPAWARLYYGSGERRYLGAPGSSTEGSDSRANSFRSGSPNTDNFPLSIYSPRRRPREIIAQVGPSGRGSLEITPAPHLGSDGQLINDPFSRKFRTWSMSSIWSPHLRLDRRATRHSMWEPPSVNWSAESGMFGRRNIQVVMFIAGFLLPFAWMIGAILPLPPKPTMEMQERDNSTSNFSSNQADNDFRRQFGPMDEARFESAKWWRRLNRWMSLLGFLIIAGVVTVVVITIKQAW